MRPEDTLFVFDKYRFNPVKRQLLRDEETVPLGSRATDILGLLIQNAGNVVEHQTLINEVWPDTFVESTALRVHISAIRKALKDGNDQEKFIVNVPGRGYVFTAPIQRISRLQNNPTFSASLPWGNGNGRLPVRLNRLVGRDITVNAAVQRLRENSFLTIVGHGGIGKTAVALAVASQMSAEFDHNTHFIDLSAITNGNLVPIALANRFQIPLHGNDVWQLVCSSLHDQRALLIFDNCEHLVDDIANIAETIRHIAPDIAILATSREPLRADGEWLLHMSPLDIPQVGETYRALLQNPAVQLFIERARAADSQFETTPENVTIIGRLCRYLDGIPFTIELLATRVDLFGLEHLESVLDDRLLLQTQGRRTALPRHQSIRAMLDWSYQQFSETEQNVFARLAVFRGPFSLSEACSVAGDNVITDKQVLQAVLNLTQRSMIERGTEEKAATYRLFGVSRSYAMEKLESSGETAQCAKRHMRMVECILEKADKTLLTVPRHNLAQQIDVRTPDIRAALYTAFEDPDEPSLAIRLATLWLRLSINLHIIDEYDYWTEKALELANNVENLGDSDRFALQLLAIVVSNLITGPLPDAARRITGLTELANKLGDPQSRTDACIGVYASAFGRADYPNALKCIGHLDEITRQHANADREVITERMRAQVLHFLGLHNDAEIHAERLLAQFPDSREQQWMTHVQVDPRISMRWIKARYLWMRGHAVSATEYAQDALGRAYGDHPHAVAHVLSLAVIPIALWSGDDEKAQKFALELASHSRKYHYENWEEWAARFAQVIHIRHGNGSWQKDAWTQFEGTDQKLLDHLPTFREDLLDSGTFARVQKEQVGWCAPEILRSHALSLYANDRAQFTTVEMILRQSIALTERQNTPAWELRSRVSLIKMLEQTHASEQAKRAGEQLAKLISTMNENKTTTDYKAACDVLSRVR